MRALSVVTYFVAYIGLSITLVESGAAESSGSEYFDDQKDLYRKEAWDQFFGYAVFFHFHPEIRVPTETAVLEALALAKHCQFAFARHVLAKNNHRFKSRTLELIELLEKIQAIDVSSKTVERTPRVFSKAVYWPISSNVASKVDQPEMLRVRIENRCTPLESGAP
jgi:hypothetical protein